MPLVWARPWLAHKVPVDRMMARARANNRGGGKRTTTLTAAQSVHGRRRRAAVRGGAPPNWRVPRAVWPPFHQEDHSHRPQLVRPAFLSALSVLSVCVCR